jgi:hypothetical protein
MRKCAKSRESMRKFPTSVKIVPKLHSFRMTSINSMSMQSISQVLNLELEH